MQGSRERAVGLEAQVGGVAGSGAGDELWEKRRLVWVVWLGG